MKKFIILSLLTLSSLVILAQNDEKFFKATFTNISIENLVTTYGANGEDEEDDSIYLQNAINDVSAHPKGGKIYVPFGRYYFSNIKLKSNVHIEFAPGTSIVPSKMKPWEACSIFILDGQVSPVKNVSIRGIEGKFNVNLSKFKNKGIVVFDLKNVQNFKIENFMIHDNYTKGASVLFGVSEVNGKDSLPRNGIIRNGSVFKANYNYGLAYVEAGENISFSDIGGQGGVTLRLESKDNALSDKSIKGISNIYAKNIFCSDGDAAVLISPNTQKNGQFFIESVYAAGCTYAVRVIKGHKDEANEQYIGYFENGSYIKNVLAVYGMRAQIKEDDFAYVPEQLRNQIARKLNIDGESRIGPSIAAIYNEVEEKQEGFYEVLIEEIDVSGFRYQRKVIINKTE